MMKDFVRFAKNGTEMRFTCKREGDRWEVRLLRNGQKNSMAVARIRKAGDIFLAPKEGYVALTIGVTALALLPQTAEDFKAWLEESIEASKSQEEREAEAEAAGPPR